jgi:hypothetical protein
MPPETEWLDEHVGQAHAGVGVEVLGALNPIVRPRQHHEKSVVRSEDLSSGDDVHRDTKHGRVEAA